MRKLNVLVVWGGVVACVAGCTTSSRLDEQTWCEKVAEVQCGWIYSCCNIGERLKLVGLNAHEESEPACREQLAGSCLEGWAVSLASISVSRVQFDIEAATTCLDTMETNAAQCPSASEEPDECKHIVTGLVGIDGECAYDGECSGQARCRRVGNALSGRCYDKAGLDGLCEGSLDCQEGLFCYQGTLPQYVCVALPTVGPGQECNGSTMVCEQGYYCDSSTDVCVAQKAAGEQCDDISECQEGLICDTSGSCGAGLGSGQTCSTYETECGVSLYCDSSTYECTPRKGSGATCSTYGNECEASLYCGTGGTCTARRAPGEGCASGSNSCQAFYACLPRGNCKARGDVGSECYGDDQCLERLQCNPDGRVCEMQPLKSPAGSFCDEGTDCESGQCESGVCIAFCSGDV